MTIDHDKHHTKIIRIPLLDISEDAADYQFLQRKTLDDLVEIVEIEEFEIYYVKDKDTMVRDNPKGIILKFTDPFKANVLIRLSKQIDINRFKEDEGYVRDCQFYSWENEQSTQIRFAKPYIDTGAMTRINIFPE